GNSTGDRRQAEVGGALGGRDTGRGRCNAPARLSVGGVRARAAGRPVAWAWQRRLVMSRPEPSFRLKLVLEQQLSLDELAELDDVRKAYAALLRDILTDNDLAAWWEDRPI